MLWSASECVLALLDLHCSCAKVSFRMRRLFEPNSEKMYLLKHAPNEDSNQPAIPDSLIFVVRMKTFCILGYAKCAQWRFWSDCANAQADLNLCWAQLSDVEAHLLSLLRSYSDIERHWTMFKSAFVLHAENMLLKLPWLSNIDKKSEICCKWPLVDG